MGLLPWWRDSASQDVMEHLNELNVAREGAFAGARALIHSDPLYEAKDVASATQKLRQGHLVLLNIAELAREDPAKLERLVAQLKDAIYRMDGDIARVSSEKLLASPPKMKFVRKQSEPLE